MGPSHHKAASHNKILLLSHPSSWIIGTLQVSPLARHAVVTAPNFAAADQQSVLHGQQIGVQIPPWFALQLDSMDSAFGRILASWLGLTDG